MGSVTLQSNSPKLEFVYDCTPFGLVIANTTNNSAFSIHNSLNPFQFSCEYRDHETNLIYYNPQTGRWLNRDPIQEGDGLNLYGMVNNNAVNVWDVLGWKGNNLSITLDLRYTKNRGDIYIPKYRNGSYLPPIQPNIEIKDIKTLIAHNVNNGVFIEKNPMSIVNFQIRFKKGQVDGLIFTCKCGWIDIGHVRHTMDRVLKLYQSIGQLSKWGTQIALKNNTVIGIGYKDFETARVVPEKFKLKRNIRQIEQIDYALNAGFLYKEHTAVPKAIDVNQYNSKFSMDDLPSNFLGAYIAQNYLKSLINKGIKDDYFIPTKQWVTAMDTIVKKRLKECGALSNESAIKILDTNRKFLEKEMRRKKKTRQTENAVLNNKCKTCGLCKKELGKDIKRVLSTWWIKF